MLNRAVNRIEPFTRNNRTLCGLCWWYVGVLYFVSTTVNPILYNVLSLRYRQAFLMTLCNSCMDDANRQRLQRDGFGAFTVFYSTARASANPASVVETYDTTTPIRRRVWGSATTSAATAVVVVGRGHVLTAPVESTTTSVGRTGAGVTLPSRPNGAAANSEPHRIRFLASDAVVVEEQSHRWSVGCVEQRQCWQFKAERLGEINASSDVKRGQNLEAEASATRPRPISGGWGQGWSQKIIMKKVPMINNIRFKIIAGKSNKNLQFYTIFARKIPDYIRQRVRGQAEAICLRLRPKFWPRGHFGLEDLTSLRVSDCIVNYV